MSTRCHVAVGLLLTPICVLTTQCHIKTYWLLQYELCHHAIQHLFLYTQHQILEHVQVCTQIQHLFLYTQHQVLEHVQVCTRIQHLFLYTQHQVLEHVQVCTPMQVSGLWTSASTAEKIIQTRMSRIYYCQSCQLSMTALSTTCHTTLPLNIANIINQSPVTLSSVGFQLNALCQCCYP